MHFMRQGANLHTLFPHYNFKFWCFNGTSSYRLSQSSKSHTALAVSLEFHPKNWTIFASNNNTRVWDFHSDQNGGHDVTIRNTLHYYALATNPLLISTRSNNTSLIWIFQLVNHSLTFDLMSFTAHCLVLCMKALLLRWLSSNQRITTVIFTVWKPPKQECHWRCVLPSSTKYQI